VETPPFTELVALPEGSRVFRQEVRAGLADCAPSGRARLDAMARWIQDVAYADVEEAGVADRAVWVVRRARIRVERFPRFGEHYELATFCSGLGRMWAERRTMITPLGGGEPAAAVQAVALWVHLDPVARRPTPLTPEEIAVYGDTAASRRVTARLRQPPPAPAAGVAAAGAAGADAERRFTWRFRATECDLADHVNNTAYWQPLEEELLGGGGGGRGRDGGAGRGAGSGPGAGEGPGSGAEPERIDVEMEFRSPAQPGEKVVLCRGNRRWILGEDGEAHASLVVVV
jgi:acyl-ACP thioesterase